MCHIWFPGPMLDLTPPPTPVNQLKLPSCQMIIDLMQTESGPCLLSNSKPNCNKEKAHIMNHLPGSPTAPPPLPKNPTPPTKPKREREREHKRKTSVGKGPAMCAGPSVACRVFSPSLLSFFLSFFPSIFFARCLSHTHRCTCVCVCVRVCFGDVLCRVSGQPRKETPTSQQPRAEFLPC